MIFFCCTILATNKTRKRLNTTNEISSKYRSTLIYVRKDQPSSSNGVSNVLRPLNRCLSLVTLLAVSLNPPLITQNITIVPTWSVIYRSGCTYHFSRGDVSAANIADVHTPNQRRKRKRYRKRMHIFSQLRGAATLFFFFWLVWSFFPSAVSIFLMEMRRAPFRTGAPHAIMTWRRPSRPSFLSRCNRIPPGTASKRRGATGRAPLFFFGRPGKRRAHQPRPVRRPRAQWPPESLHNPTLRWPLREGRCGMCRWYLGCRPASLPLVSAERSVVCLACAARARR